MSDANLAALVVQVEFLVRRKFGNAVQETLKRGGRVTRYPTEADELIKQAEEYEAELFAVPPEQLQVLYEEERAKERMELQAKADREEAQRFFNQPEAEADFEHWSKAAYWTLDEAVALSLGKAPEVVSWKTVEGYVGRSRFADQYRKVRDLALRATRSQQLYDPVLPGFYLAWAKRNGIDCPAELAKQVEAHGHQIADWKSLYDGLQAQYNDAKAHYDDYAAKIQAVLDEDKNLIDALAGDRDSLRSRVAQLEQALGQGQAEKPLPRRERDTALKLIIGMAVGGYCYDPKAKRSDKIRDIVRDLDSAGVSLDDDTVRKWLREAAELLPREALDNKDR